MEVYLLNENKTEILSGPHEVQSQFVRELTCCGNPECLDLETYRLYTPVAQSLGVYEQFSGAAILVVNGDIVRGVESKPIPEIATILDNALTAYLDEVAALDRWSNRITCALRASYPNVWRERCTKFAVWMDQCNEYGYQVQKDCMEGKRTIPTPTELIAELPEFTW